MAPFFKKDSIFKEANYRINEFRLQGEQKFKDLLKHIE